LYLLNIVAIKFHYIILIGILAGIAFTLIIHRMDFAIRGIIYILPGLLVVIFLYNMYKQNKKIPDKLYLIQIDKKILLISFILIFILSVVSLYLTPTRPGYYFVLITILFSIIFLQIFGDQVNPKILLFEISCALGNIIFGLTLKYPLFFGFTDIIPHLYYTKITMLSGHIIPADLDPSYAYFPLYHIFLAAGSDILGTNLQFSFFILTSLTFIAVIWFVYLLFYQVTKNDQTSLLICLVFSTTPIVIIYSTYVVTRVFAFIGFIFLLFLAYKHIRTSKQQIFSTLILITTIFIILVHQVSILQIVPLLIFLIVLELIVGDYYAMRTKLIAFIILTFSAYWIFIAFDFTNSIVMTVESINTPEVSQLRSQVQTGNEFIFLENNISTAIIIFFIFLGIGYVCWAYKSKYLSVFGLLALLLTPFYFPSPITASRVAMITLRTDRFVLLISPFFACAFAIGLLVLLHRMYDNKISRNVALLLGIIIFSYLCYSALTGNNASDSPDISQNQSRVYFTTAELSSFNFISGSAEYGTSVSSDQYASRMFENKLFSETESLHLPYFNLGTFMDHPEAFTFTQGLFLLRAQELNENGLVFPSRDVDYGETFQPTQATLSKFFNLTVASQKIYDNHEVTILSN